jgi:hypothetical protein
MTATDLYNKLVAEVDRLQKQAQNLDIKQNSNVKTLEEIQGKMKSLEEMIVREGDRDLTQEELLALGI